MGNISLCGKCIYLYVDSELDPCLTCDANNSGKALYEINYNNYRNWQPFEKRHMIARENGLWKEGTLGERKVFKGYCLITKLSDISDLGHYISLKDFMSQHRMPSWTEDALLESLTVDKMFIKMYVMFDEKNLKGVRDDEW